MSAASSIDVDDLVLPFDTPVGHGMPPAPRCADTSLGGVVVVDNLRMTVAPYDAIPVALQRAHPAWRVGLWARNLMTASRDELDEFADAIVAARPSGVVLGLGEAGVTQPTIELALALERRGVPTATLCSEPGLALARACAMQAMPGLRIVELPIRPFFSREEVGAAVSAASARIVAALTDDAFATPRDVETPLKPDPSAVREAWREALGSSDVATASLAFLHACERFGLSDGLPLVPPTRRRVESLIDACGRSAGDVLVPPLPPADAALTVSLAAANAAMVGCEPAAFGVVVAALEALARPRMRLHQAAITTHPGVNMIVVSGPLAQAAGLSAGAGCLGPGNRAAMSISRAVNLCMTTVLRSLPGSTDLSTQGTVARYGVCFTDRTDQPWPPLHVALGHPAASTVTVHRCSPAHNVLDHRSRTAESLVVGLAAASTSLACNNAWCPSELLVILSPDHAAILQRDGWHRRDLQRRLWESARNPRALLDGRGLTPSWPPSFAGLDPVPVAERPEDILVVIAGGAGPHSQVATPWGLSRAVTVAVAT